jgi:2,5-diketo-D-gluconate reductase A
VLAHDSKSSRSEAHTATSATIGVIELNDGQFIPPMGIGTWPLTNSEAQEAVELALAAGYRLIDTASIYGNEEGVGRAIAASGVRREEIVVTSKLDAAEQGYESTFRAFDASCKRLGLDTIDLYLIHWPMPELGRYVESWRAMIELNRNGVARSIGVSNFDPQQIEDIIAATGRAPAVNQVPLNPEFQQTRLRGFHEGKRIVTEAYSPLGKGDVLRNRAILDIAAKHERTPAQIVLRWCMQLNIVAIPKTQTPERIRENIDIFNFELDAEDLAAIARL